MPLKLNGQTIWLPGEKKPATKTTVNAAPAAEESLPLEEPVEKDPGQE